MTKKYEIMDDPILNGGWEQPNISINEWLNKIEKYIFDRKTFLEKLQDLSGLPKRLYDLFFWKHKRDK